MGGTQASMTQTAGNFLTLAKPRRLAVLRALHLGDMLCAVPALRALRDACPEARITLIGLPWAAAFVQRFSRYLDDLLVLPGFPGFPEQPAEPQSLLPFLKEAQSRDFDLVLQLQGNGYIANVLAVLIGGRRTGGFFRPGEYCPDPGLVLEYPDALPESDRLP